MKTMLNKNRKAGRTLPRSLLAATATLLLAMAISSLAEPGQVLRKKDGNWLKMSWWMGGWEQTGGPEKLYFWMVFPQVTTVFKETPDGLFYHDCRAKGTAIIASAQDGEDPDTEPYPENTRYVGVGTMVDTGLWAETTPGSGAFVPAGKMTWTITATVSDVVTGEKWRLYWHLLLRDGEYTENYSFEPVK